ncbi:MAG TPA: NAD(P)H-dependent glycerol-3-phosphate dehydrogenase [Fimbriimonadaceae bacterium]|nr:NAD(P)H-dependent glycerol-3-phosphate dehydrogenase [Fimbriimonadaceae bacterium]
MDVSVAGAGSWGTALSLVLARNSHTVQLLGREDDHFASLRSLRENLTYLPGYALPKDVEFGVLGVDKPASDLVVLAVPSGAVREVMQFVAGATTICIASKGLDPVRGAVLSEVVSEVAPEANIVALSGPNLAAELARGVPSAAVAASESPEEAERVRRLFMSKNYRIYVSDDVKGVELAGSLKNVMAIAAGMSDGLGYGDNTKGALLARGLSEMARLGTKLGARVDTFLGVAGVGDLFATAVSTLSRNYRVGYGLGKGRRISDILEEIGQVAEGVSTTDAALRLARQLGVSVPITEVVDGVIKERLRAKDVVPMLMERAPASEGGFGS